jgi:thiamine-phosphate pyrophosphorylase
VRGPLPRLHAITDERVARRPDVQEIARDLAAGGGEQLALHARGRELTGREHYELADRLSACPPARPFVNDRLDIALAARATGVQLGHGSVAPADARRLNPEWWIGMSVRDLDEARAAETAGADYLLIGPVYATLTHPDRPLLGVHGFAEIARVGLPAIAIGGVTAERVVELRVAGAYGVAAIRALWDAVEPSAAARAMLDALGARG